MGLIGAAVVMSPILIKYIPENPKDMEKTLKKLHIPIVENNPTINNI